MTPVHPIETSEVARRPHDRRPNGVRRAPAFQLPADAPPASDLAIHATPPVSNLAVVMLSADDSVAAPTADEASQAFVDNVTRVMRTPQRITGWFVDLIV